MTNFIFKSAAADLQKISQQLNLVLNEQRHQRSDLGLILRELNKLINADNLQKQVDEFYESSPVSNPEDRQDLD